MTPIARLFVITFAVDPLDELSVSFSLSLSSSLLVASAFDEWESSSDELVAESSDVLSLSLLAEFDSTVYRDSVPQFILCKVREMTISIAIKIYF